MRRSWVGICVTVIVVASGCGGGDMSLSEYVDEMNTIGARIAQQSEVVVAEAEQIATSLYHHFAGSVPILYESPQGVLDSEAPWSHEEIVDACMCVVSCLCEELLG